MRLRLPRVLHVLVPAFAALTLAACTELGGLFGEGDDPESARAQAETATVFELTISAGRHAVMLEQARGILKLPEPNASPDAPAASGESLAERRALAAQQVLVASEFYTDAARACAKKRTPKKLRQMACAYRDGTPAELRRPAALDVAALSARNEAIDKIVMPWWDAACATVPRRGPDDEPACPME